MKQNPDGYYPAQKLMQWMALYLYLLFISKACEANSYQLLHG